MSQNNTSILYVGLVVAKASLQLDLAGQPHSLTNDPKGHAQLLKLLRKHPTAQIVCEATGGYEKAAARGRHFARALGQRAKTDPIDAPVLSAYGRASQPPATVANNRANKSGGIRGHRGRIDLNHCTVTANSCDKEWAGGIGLFESELTFGNSIVAGNRDADEVITPNNFRGANLTSGDPHLAPLGRYGGLTATMPPLPGSPALDAAISSVFTNDQRGFPRPTSARWKARSHPARSRERHSLPPCLLQPTSPPCAPPRSGWRRTNCNSRSPRRAGRSR